MVRRHRTQMAIADKLQVFINGVNFTDPQPVVRALTSFYGIGSHTCTRIMAKFSIHQTAKIGQLNLRQVDGLASELSKMTLENDLRRKLVENITRLRDMGSYRGRRHAMGLPVRGQGTRTNAKTAKKLNRVERRQ
ncbi:ribosomal protein S13 [Piedraia hortae CBS 480.64]|uniref:Small ribosomal subunit protein uS13m n=1 Tax=Piedraia hortae CBS 480.64 TaxID=1314780 RepID=A0A6A7C8D4_9PEZI|nr:ribosomal protein S13 [Piedraia hortae CBS 480.64]